MIVEKKICVISVDMDPIWHYLNARGYEAINTIELNAVYNKALPKFLDIFDQYNVKATFFLVGKDAIEPKNKLLIREIVKRGHEVANHTYNHYQHFSRLTYEEKKYEIEETDKILSDITGGKIEGFRAPGWGITSETIEILETLGYFYDSSVFPSLFVSIIASVTWFMNKGRLKKSLGTSWTVGLAPKIPYVPSRDMIWKTGSPDRGKMKIIELPPTILPIIQIPFLGTLLYMFGKHIFSLCFHYFNMFSHPLIYELHGIELVDYYESINDKRLLVKPGLSLTIQTKIDLYNFMLSKFRTKYQFLTMKELGELCKCPAN